MDERSPSFWSEDKSGTKRAHRSPTGETPTAKRQATADNHSGKSAARKSLFQNESSALNSTRDVKSPSGHIVPKPKYKLTGKAVKQPWSEKEITRLHELVSSAPSRTHQFFKECAEKLSTEFLTPRTGSTCNAKYYYIQKRGRTFDENVPQRQSHAWSEKEISRLHELAKNSPSRNFDFFKQCAATLTNEFSTQRTGTSCCAKYYDTKNTAQKKHTKTPSGSSSTHQKTANIPLSKVKVGKKTRDPSTAAEKIHTYTQKTANTFTDLLTEGDQSQLNTALQSRSISGLAKQLLQIGSLKRALWNAFVQEVREDSPQFCRQGVSLLSKTEYADVKSFSWDLIMDEMMSHSSMLLDILLAYTVPVDKQHNGTLFDQLPPVLGMTYAAIMKCRSKKLSLVQHVVSLTLVEEKAHKKVLIPSLTCRVH